MSNLRKETEFTKRATSKDYKHPSSNDLMKSIAGAWEELKCTHCGKRLTIDQDNEGANTLYCNETCKRLHNSMAPIATCAYCGNEGSDVNNECNKCHTVKYCNATCKKKHRKKHKKVCERIVSDGLIANSNISSEETSDEIQSNFESSSDLLGQIHTESVDTTNQTPEMPSDGPNKVNLRRSIQRHEDTKSIRRTLCKGDNCKRGAKLSSGYCLTCDRKYNHGGSYFKQSVKQREEKEENMNMDACYKCQKEDDNEELRKCDFCTRFYHSGCNSWSADKEFKCSVCKSDEGFKKWEEEEKEDTSPSPPSSSNVSNANTVSNEQTPAQVKTLEDYVKSRGGNQNWSNRLLHQAMGIEEETPPEAAETREEDTSPSSSLNANTVLDKDGRMIRLFESITIKDDEPNSDDKRLNKDALFKIMNNEDDHFVLSDKQQNDLSVWLDRCKEQINDVTLFQLPTRSANCPMCHIQLPHLSSGKVYMSCCGKVLCRGCIHMYQCESDNRNGSLCVFCKVPMPDSDDEVVKRYVKRILLYESGDSACTLGCFYQSGMFGLPQSYAKALKLYYWAIHLHSIEACCNIADAYDRGLGVERDYEKAWIYYEYAAMRGNVNARYNLGVSEMLVGNKEKALKHFMMAVKTGHADSCMKIKQLNMNLHATDQEYLEALMTYNAYLVKIEGPLRDQAAAFSNDYRYYEPLRGKVKEEAEKVEEKLPDGVKEDDIRLVMSQVAVTRKRAIKALVENDCDSLDAIMSFAA